MALAPDDRTQQRRDLDEAIAAEEKLPPPDLPTDAVPRPLETRAPRRPVALAGVMENGVVRLLDPTVRLPERCPVIVVANA